jgi:hypothetical protein
VTCDVVDRLSAGSSGGGVDSRVGETQLRSGKEITQGKENSVGTGFLSHQQSRAMVIEVPRSRSGSRNVQKSSSGLLYLGC